MDNMHPRESLHICGRIYVYSLHALSLEIVVVVKNQVALKAFDDLREIDDGSESYPRD